MVGFTGSRTLPASYAALVGQVAAHFAAAGPIATGCAAGADQFVRQAVPGCQVFAASQQTGPAVARLAKRSAALVRAVHLAGGQVVGFPAHPCPPGCQPRRSFAAHGSGTWGTLALAAGLGLPVVVCWCGAGPVQLPGWGHWQAVFVAGQLAWQLGGSPQIGF